MPRRPQRVMMTVDSVGGVWTYALDLAGGLAEAGLDVMLAHLGPPPTRSQRLQATSIPGVWLIETGLPLDWLAPDAAAVALAARQLGGLAARYGADLIHLNSPAFAADAGFVVPTVGACHSCPATWWDAVHGGEAPDDFRWRIALQARGHDACDVLVAPSAAFARATFKHYGCAPQVIWNGRDSGGRRADPAGKQRVVLTAGRLWDAGKNIAALGEVAAGMRGTVLAAGAVQGPRREASVLGPITALGRLDEAPMTQRLNQAAVFASLALYEPFGLGVLEAAQAGCALVLSDIPSFRELWSGAAVFVAAADHAGVAATLDELLDSPAMTEQLGRLAATRAAAFTRQAMVEQTLAAYGQVLSRERALASGWR